MSLNTKYIALFVLVSLASSAIAKPDLCLERPRIGTCRAALLTYYFNPETGSCDCFLFGGCNGGRNNFKTIGDCMETCEVKPFQQITSSDCQRLTGGSRPLPSLPGVSQSGIDQLQNVFTETANQHISQLGNQAEHKLPSPPSGRPVSSLRPKPPANLFPLVSVPESPPSGRPVSSLRPRPANLFPLITVPEGATQTPIPPTKQPTFLTRRPIPAVARTDPATRRPVPTTQRPLLTTKKSFPTAIRPLVTPRRPSFPPKVPGVKPARPFSQLLSDFDDRIMNRQQQTLQEIIRKQRKRELQHQMLQQEQLQEQRRQQQRLHDSLEAQIASG